MKKQRIFASIQIGLCLLIVGTFFMPFVSFSPYNLNISLARIFSPNPTLLSPNVAWGMLWVEIWILNAVLMTVIFVVNLVFLFSQRFNNKIGSTLSLVLISAWGGVFVFPLIFFFVRGGLSTEMNLRIGFYLMLISAIGIIVVGALQVREFSKKKMSCEGNSK